MWYHIHRFTINQSAYGRRTTTKTKLMLTFGVIGLIGFGFLVATISRQAVVEENIVPEQYKTVAFTAGSETELETKVLDALEGSDLTSTQKTEVVDYFVSIGEGDTGGDQGLSWGGDPRPRCNSCGFGSIGLCIYGVCGSGSCDIDFGNHSCLGYCQEIKISS